MPSPYLILLSLSALLALVDPTLADVRFEVPNPSFEEDMENDGMPDGWKVPQTAKVDLSQHTSHGVKAARFTEGYVLVALDQKLTGLAGQAVNLSFDVAGEGDARLGVIVAYNHRQPDGSAKFAYHHLTWNRPLKRDYTTLALPIRFADDAVDGRVWLGVYRSNRQGVVYLDNFRVAQSGPVPAEQAAELARVHREWSYLLRAAREAAAEDIIRAAENIVRRSEQQDVSLLADTEALQQQWQEHYAQLHQLRADGRPFIVSWSEGITRLDPAAPIPASLRTDETQTALRGTYQALGVTVWNARPEPVTLAVTIEGLDAAANEIVVRRQVFLENWYDKEKVRTADALPLLAREGDAWQLPLEAGEAAKLYIGYRVKADASGEYAVSVSVSDDGQSGQTLRAMLDILPAPLPATPRLEHWQCAYLNTMPAGRYPEQAAKDLAAHYVTSMQFPWAPKAEFDSDGHLLRHDFSSTEHARWMRAYAPYIDQLWLFWEGSLINVGIKDREGRKIEAIGADGKWTPAFRTAFTELLRAWLDFAEQEGFGIEHWAIVPDDEPRSAEAWAEAPGPAIRRAVELYEMVRQVEPELPIQVTLGNYSLPEDVRALLPGVDVALPVYPYPEKLTRWSPPDYDPQLAYEQQIRPMLMQARRDKGLQIWSYKVSRGIKDDLLSKVLSYPVQAVAEGYTGIGFWAYNVIRGKSWDDRDGGLLDYTFIYNGLEDHPLNHRYNVTEEVVVPSIRWEALRIGYQHGQVLLTLRDRHERGRIPEALRPEVEALLKQTDTFGPTPGSNEMAEYLAFADRLVRTYAAVYSTSPDQSYTR